MDLIAQVIFTLTEIMTFAIFGRVIMSWIMQMNPSSTFLMSAYRVLVQITDPILAPLRRIVPTAGMFDFTPIVAIILLQIIGRMVAEFL